MILCDSLEFHFVIKHRDQTRLIAGDKLAFEGVEELPINILTIGDVLYIQRQSAGQVTTVPFQAYSQIAAEISRVLLCKRFLFVINGITCFLRTHQINWRGTKPAGIGCPEVDAECFSAFSKNEFLSTNEVHHIVAIKSCVPLYAIKRFVF